MATIFIISVICGLLFHSLNLLINSLNKQMRMTKIFSGLFFIGTLLVLWFSKESYIIDDFIGLLILIKIMIDGIREEEIFTDQNKRMNLVLSICSIAIILFMVCFSISKI